MKSFVGLVAIIFLEFGVANSQYTTLNSTKIFHVNSMLKANWHRALHYCLANEMRLAVIESKEENDRVSELIEDSGFIDDFWLGGTRVGNNKFYWMGIHKSMKFNAWGEGQPDRSDEDCIATWKVRANGNGVTKTALS